MMRIKGKGSFKRWQQSKKEKELVDEYEEEFESYNFKQVKQAISHKILIYLSVGLSDTLYQLSFEKDTVNKCKLTSLLDGTSHNFVR